MRKGLGVTSLVTPLMLLSSCHVPPQDYSPRVVKFETDNYVRSDSDKYVYYSLKPSGEQYKLPKDFYEIVYLNLKFSDMDVIYETDIINKIAPIADTNKDRIIGFQDAYSIYFSSDTYNKLVDMVNDYCGYKRLDRR